MTVDDDDAERRYIDLVNGEVSDWGRWNKGVKELKAENFLATAELIRLSLAL